MSKCEEVRWSRIIFGENFRDPISVPSRLRFATPHARHTGALLRRKLESALSDAFIVCGGGSCTPSSGVMSPARTTSPQPHNNCTSIFHIAQVSCEPFKNTLM